jgi:dipeptidase E
MKLYLASVGTPNVSQLLALFPDAKNLSVAIIPNAWDVYPLERRTAEIEKCLNNFSEIGFRTSLVNLKAESGKKLKDELVKHSLVWVMGGNSFYLNQLAHQSGFNNLITDLMSAGLVYGGESAGAVLACPTLHGVQLLDDPKDASEVIWEGLGLVEFGVVPHWGMEKYADLLEQCRKEMAGYVTVRTLTNEQALIVNEDEIKIVEKG